MIVEITILVLAVAVVAIGIGIDLGYDMAQEAWAENADDHCPLIFRGRSYKVKHYAATNQSRALQQGQDP